MDNELEKDATADEMMESEAVQSTIEETEKENEEMTTEDLVTNLVIEHNALVSLLLEKGIIIDKEFDAKIEKVEKEMLGE